MPFNFRRMPKPVKMSKVLAINFRPPAIPAEWGQTSVLAEEYSEAMIQASHKMLVYKVIKILDVPLYPVFMDGRQYNDATWTQARQNGQAALRDAHGNFLLADYGRILQDYGIAQAIEKKIIDEVWLFGGPYFGFYESRMAGQKAFWCNAPGLELACRRFVAMGFNYERGVREMIHSFGHRAESILAAYFGSQAFLQGLYGGQPNLTPMNEFEEWLLEHGTIHRKPGGVDYGQDEYAWVSALKTSWWRPIIDANLVKV
ncbi:MAG: hypothetical protein IT310_11830 [Anaerolineales bacterium]|nr:hypothetical protein [Anaerolineales bacterium]